MGLWLALVVPVSAEELVGQITCSNCWLEADRSVTPYGTTEDIECAGRCADDGIPLSLAIARGGAFVLVELTGEAPDGRPWLELVGEFARIEGAYRETAQGPMLDATGVELLEESPFPTPAVAPAAGLSWIDLRGRRQDLSAYRGRIVVLNFWATWCAPCKKEMPDLAAIQRDYGVYGVQVVGASADTTAESEHVLGFARRTRINFPVVLGATTDQMQALGLGIALPATAVLDEDGHVVARFNGLVRKRQLEEVLDRQLAGEGHAHDHASLGAHRGHRHAPGSNTQASLVPS